MSQWKFLLQLSEKYMYAYIYPQVPLCVFRHSLLFSGFFPPIAKAQQ